MEAVNLKTFKIVALQVLEEQQAVNIPLTDGLTINKESEDGVWIIEAFIEKKYGDIFKQRFEQNESFEIRVVITHAANDPAPFTVTIYTIREFINHMSILLEGRLSRKRHEYSALLLDELINEGYTGEQLIEEFKKRMKLKVK